jgi:hypothetical protein
MSATSPTDPFDLRKYLLGQLPEEEERGLEARLLEDPELFELAEATEAEILDEYFRGELTAADPAEGQGLLDRLSASPAGRRRIALARGLAAITATPARPELAEVLPFRPRLLARPAMQAALAAALVGAAVAVWQLYPGAPTTKSARVERPAAITKTARIVPSPQPEVPPFVCNLSLDTLRGGGEQLKVIPIPAAATRVELRLPLSPAETSAAYEVTLRREGEATWGPRRLAAPRPAGTPLAVRLPASALAAGTYELEVRGVAPDGSTELVGTPVFRVIH